MKGIEFKGKALEYFGIWLANILLTVVTIGIFSAWAKVRRLKYFYNNTNILENSFAYHATGWQIFKGRLIAFVVILPFPSEHPLHVKGMDTKGTLMVDGTIRLFGLAEAS